MSFASRLQSSRNELLWLVKAKDNSIDCWYYVLVEKMKLQMFIKHLKSDFMHVNDYGEIIMSGWGKEPPESVKKKMADF